VIETNRRQMNKCNVALSAICGFVFAVAWWLFVDGCAIAGVNGSGKIPFWVFCPGILCTIGLFLMSNLPPTMFQKDNGAGDETTGLQKAILLFAVMFKASGVIVAIWCYVAKAHDRVGGYEEWRGISTIVQSVLIVSASFAWNFLYQDPNASGF
jgi:hypothetical protein